MSNREQTQPLHPDEPRQRGLSPWRITAMLSAALVAASVIGCVVMAAARSTGVVTITVTAMGETEEPRDHNLPLVRQKEALPDYELQLILTNGDRVQLGVRPDTSAAGGLTWHINDPVSTADVASVRLTENDKMISDAVAEVQIVGNSATAKGYQFQFVSKRSLSIGLKSFFRTPIGMAISAGFCIAIVVMLVGTFHA